MCLEKKNFRDYIGSNNFRSYIGSNVKLGRGTNIDESLCYISDNCVLGDGVKLGFGVYLGPGCKIGSHTVIEPNTVFGPNTQIGAWSAIGSQVTSQGNNVVGHFVRINNQSQIGAGMVVEDRVFIGPRFVPSNTKNIQYSRASSAFMDGSRIRFGARIGSGVTVLPGVEIGREAFVGAGSVVTKDIPAFHIAFGNPAVPKREIPEEEKIDENLYLQFVNNWAKSTHFFGYKWIILGSLKVLARRIMNI